MKKKILIAALAAGVFFSPVSVMAGEITTQTKEISETVETTKSLESATTQGGNSKTLNTMLTAALLGGKDFSSKDVTSTEGEVTGGFTDKWLLGALSSLNGKFNGIDTSSFTVFETQNNLTANLYNLSTAKMMEQGWGQIPKSGLFSNSNGFEGYSIEGNTNISAQQLFANEYSDAYNSFKNGTFDSNIPGLKQMIKDFNDNFNKESSKFANSNLYTSAKNLMNTVDINKGIDTFKNTPGMMSAASLAGLVASHSDSVDAAALKGFGSAQAKVNAAAVSPLAGFKSADGSVDIAGVARGQFDNLKGTIKTNIGYNSVKSAIDAAGDVDIGSITGAYMHNVVSQNKNVLTNWLFDRGGGKYDSYDSLKDKNVKGMDNFQNSFKSDWGK